MNRIDRLFGILTLLQSRKYVPAEKIAERFNISIRTVYRDVKALCEQGIPVSFEQNKGYFVVREFFLPPVSFTNEEANAFLLMEALVDGFADQSIRKHYSCALNKVKAVLRHSQKEKLELLDNNIKLQIPECFRQNFEYLSALQEAISSHSIISMGYKNNNGEVSNRKAEPIGLIFYALNWHLIAWCHRRSEYRDFRVSRIMSVTATGDTFDHKKHLSVDEYMKSLPVNY